MNEIVDKSTSSGWFDNKNPDGKDLVRRLAVGSETIDRMRQEINSVVSAVLGIVEQNCGITREQLMKQFLDDNWPEFYSSQTKWKVWAFPMSVGKMEKMVWSADLYSKENGLLYSSARGSQRIKLRDVQGVHESLSPFISGMRSRFPLLDDCWQPFLDAADYAEENGW